MSVPIPEGRERALLRRLARPAGAAPLRVLCSGIGGTGLSGLARIVHGLGHVVRGSDRAASPRCERLQGAGIPVTVGQRAANVDASLDLVVATAALPPDHPERLAAQRLGVPVVKYARALGALVAERRAVAVAGTHGKTTTTALAAHVLRSAGLDPSWIVGGDPKDLPANAHLAGDALVFEACEYDRSFRHYSPAVAVLLNVEEDHLDCYPGGLPAIVDAFVEFAQQLRPGGTLVASLDCPGAAEVVRRARSSRPDLKVVTFSTDAAAAADVVAAGLHEIQGLPAFELRVAGRAAGRVRLGVPGRHNAANALAAVAVAVALGVDAAAAAAAIPGFGGVGRRFDVHRLGDVAVVEDYAHHPTAIAAVVAAARARFPGRRVVACFEPHQASRTRDLYPEFVAALGQADRVLLSDIYLCRDSDEAARAVSAAELARDVAAAAPETEARHAGDLQALERAALDLAGAGDVLLFLGAGRIGEVAQRVAAALGPEVGRARPRGAGRLEERVTAALGSRVALDAPLAPLCTYRTGGASRFLVAPRSEHEAIEAARVFGRLGVPVVPLGGGSNTLFAGGRLDAAVLHTRGMRGARVLGQTVRASAGASLPGLIRLAERHGLAGLEHLAGIPGTIGGAVFGNAGGPPGADAVGDLVARARVVEPDGAVRWRTRGELGLRYRGSDLAGCLVLGVDLALRPGDRQRLRRARLAATERKRAVQPLDARSAGCVFRNPPGQSAGRLIDGLGLKGLRRGGASVSTVHANFIVNDGDASPEDVVALVDEVRRRVLVATGVRLHTELRLVA